MPTFYDSNGNALNLSERIGSGGEGTVFVCPDDRAMVAKIYHEPISAEKAEKLRWMAAHKDEQLLKIAAWVTDVLTDAPDGKVVGFLMPNVRAKEIHELYSLKSRRVHFPDATWTFLVHAAANLARAFYNLHKNDHVMGDINHGNCVVLADGTVKLIDCDSYSISDGAQRYACEVGVATHLAPELQGISLRGVVREQKHDNFGLAVIIFQLLFLGRHPFAGNYLGGEDKTLEDSISERRFAYGTDAPTRGVRQPPGTLSLSAVPPRLALMFERAFLTEDRPEPREWIEALEDLKENLKQCAIHPGHHFSQNLTACPWCELEAKTGLMLFPFTSGKHTLDDEESFNIFTVENLLAQINPARNLPALLPKTSLMSAVKPEERIVNERHDNLKHLMFFSVGQIGVIVMLTMVFGVGAAFFVGLITMTAALIFTVNNYKNVREVLEYELETRQTDWEKLQLEWQKANAADYLESDIAAIRGKVEDYQNLQQDSRQKIKLLQDEALRYQLETHLANYSLADAKISGVKRERLLDLQRFGIKTAADVERKRLQTLPETNGFLNLKLLDWRKDLERNFEYQPNVRLPESSHQRVLQEFNEQRRRIEKEIEKLLTNVRMASGSLQLKQQQVTARSEKLNAELAQAEANLQSLGSNAPTVFTLLLVTGISLVISSSFLSFNDASNYSKISGTDNGIRAVKTYPYESVKPTSFDGNAPDEASIPKNLSDKEIVKMSDSERRKTADTLFSYAMSQTLNNKGDAEKSLLLAAKLCNTDVCSESQVVSIFGQLGNIYFKLGRYNEALDYFKKSLAVQPQNYVTELYIGSTYLKLGKFRDAREVFYKVTKSSPDLFEAHYNLGLAFEKEKNYSMALDSLNRAAQILPENADAHLALGRCYYKNIEFQKAENQYQKLLTIDEDRASDLRSFIDSKGTADIESAEVTGIGSN